MILEILQEKGGYTNQTVMHGERWRRDKGCYSKIFVNLLGGGWLGERAAADEQEWIRN